jgi:hypothetical protein
MPTYRFYKLTSGKRIAAPGEDRDFDNDLLAFEHAKSLPSGHSVGIWAGARFVANVESEDIDARTGSGCFSPPRPDGAARMPDDGSGGWCPVPKLG